MQRIFNYSDKSIIYCKRTVYSIQCVLMHRLIACVLEHTEVSLQPCIYI